MFATSYAETAEDTIMAYTDYIINVPEEFPMSIDY